MFAFDPLRFAVRDFQGKYLYINWNFTQDSSTVKFLIQGREKGFREFVKIQLACETRTHTKQATA